MAATTEEGTVKRMVGTVLAIRNELKEEMVERGTEIDLLIACTLARVHMILLGEPGVAKSMLVDQFFAHVEGANQFSALLSKNTLPEEVFGPPSMKGLENDDFHFVTDGYLPWAHIAFLDEVFKSNSAVLNGQLKIINERTFQGDPCPLWSMVGASNELPTHDREDLMAFSDRIGIRKVVMPVRASDAVMQVLDGQLARNRGDQVAGSRTTIAREDIEALQGAVANVAVPAKVQRALAELKSKSESKGLTLSLRRIFEGLRVCQAQALLQGRREVRAEDLRVFEHVLWNDPEEIRTATDLTIDFSGAVGRIAAERRTEFEGAQQKFADVQRQMPASSDDEIPNELLDELMKVSAVFKQVDKRVEQAVADADDSGWDASELETLRTEVKRSRMSIRDLLGMGE